MEVRFKGSPLQVLTEMKEFIARLSMEFSESPVTSNKENAPTQTHKPPEPDPEPTAASTSSESHAASSNVSGETGPQKSDASVCQFCGRSGKHGKPIGGGHTNFCKKNPNRKVHAKEGTTLNPGLRKWLDEKRASKDQSGSPSPKSQDSQSSSPNETAGTNEEIHTSDSQSGRSTQPTLSGEEDPF